LIHPVTCAPVSSNNIFVTGLGKSGTTALYQAVKSGLRKVCPEAITVFEPTRPDVVDNVFRLAPGTPVLTKVTVEAIDRLRFDPRAFERRITTVRDPRDIAVSMLLFRPLIARSIRNLSRADLERFVGALRRKEADPASVSVRELYELQAELGMGPGAKRSLCHVLDRQLKLLTDGDVHTVRYENFVTGDTAALSDYLGFAVTNAPTAQSATFGHIVRSRRSGGYAHWFREDDVEYFDTLLGPYLDKLGYPREVALADPPALDPAEGSEYVQSRFTKRRAQHERQRMSLAEDTDAPVNTRATFDELVDRADNGDPTACVQVAKAAASGEIDGVGHAEALRWARAAAVHGKLQGMRLTCRLLDQIEDPGPAVRRERRAWAIEVRARSHTETGHVEQLRAELDRIRGSRRYRVGQRMADAVSDPRHGIPAAARELWSAWRRRRDSQP
jgi:hypothetical protein